MELKDAAVAVPGETVRRDDRFGADLEILAGPDDPGLDRADRLTGRYAIDRRREGDLDQWDQLTERGTKPNVLYAAFEIGEAVFEGEAVVEGRRFGTPALSVLIGKPKP